MVLFFSLIVIITFRVVTQITTNDVQYGQTHVHFYITSAAADSKFRRPFFDLMDRAIIPLI